MEQEGPPLWRAAVLVRGRRQAARVAYYIAGSNGQVRTCFSDEPEVDEWKQLVEETIANIVDSGDQTVSPFPPKKEAWDPDNHLHWAWLLQHLNRQQGFEVEFIPMPRPEEAEPASESFDHYD